MTPSVLGYSVLLYAVFTASAGLRLIYLIVGNWDGNWFAVGEALIWLLFIVGGVGLICNRAWSRIVLYVAGVASALVGVATLVSLWKLGMLPAGLFSVLTVLVSVAIVILVKRLPATAALKAQIPPDQTDKRVESRRIDLAYGCFALSVFVAWIEPIGKLLPINPEAGQVLLMLLTIPIVLIALIAPAVAFIVSVMEWREWPLLIMTGILASMMFVFFAIDKRGLGMEGSYVEPMWYVGGSVILIAFCVRWFAFVRRRGAPRAE